MSSKPMIKRSLSPLETEVAANQPCSHPSSMVHSPLKGKRSSTSSRFQLPMAKQNSRRRLNSILSSHLITNICSKPRASPTSSRCATTISKNLSFHIWPLMAIKFTLTCQEWVRKIPTSPCALTTLWLRCFSLMAETWDLSYQSLRPNSKKTKALKSWKRSNKSWTSVQTIQLLSSLSNQYCSNASNSRRMELILILPSIISRTSLTNKLILKSRIELKWLLLRESWLRILRSLLN